MEIWRGEEGFLVYGETWVVGQTNKGTKSSTRYSGLLTKTTADLFICIDDLFLPLLFITTAPFPNILVITLFNTDSSCL